jgi:N-acyl-D-aspartate/D-glutamate deacylase
VSWNPHDDFITLLLAAMAAPWFRDLVKALIDKLTGNTSIKQMMSKIIADLRNEREDRLQSEAKACRSRVIRFNDELLNNVHHSKSMFDTILIDCSDYEKYCAEHPQFRNSVATEAIENIKRTYRKCEEDHDFL